MKQNDIYTAGKAMGYNFTEEIQQECEMRWARYCERHGIEDNQEDFDLWVEAFWDGVLGQ